jgi:hypothetical protein
MPIAARETLTIGSRVSYGDSTGLRRQGEIIEVLADEYRVHWDDGGETISDLRQYCWWQLALLPGNLFDGSPILFAYTRERALADGELVAIETGIAREAGFVWPIAVSRALWQVVEPNEREALCGQSVEGRLWDLLTVSRLAIKSAKEDGTAIDFPVLFYEVDRGRRAGLLTYNLRLETGPGDHGEPVVTIGCPEDF